MLHYVHVYAFLIETKSALSIAQGAKFVAQLSFKVWPILLLKKMFCGLRESQTMHFFTMMISAAAHAQNASSR